MALHFLRHDSLFFEKSGHIDTSFVCSRDQLSTPTYEVGVQQDFRSQKLMHIFNSSLIPPIPHSHMPTQLQKHAKNLNTANTSINMTQTHETVHPNLKKKKKKLHAATCCLCETRHRPRPAASNCYNTAQCGCWRRRPAACRPPHYRIRQQLTEFKKIKKK